MKVAGQAGPDVCKWGTSTGVVRVARSWVETLKGLTLGVSGGVQGVRLQYF
jgi:hypothetical protein